MKSLLVLTLIVLPIIAQAQTRRVFRTLAEMDAAAPSRDEPISEVAGFSTPGDWGPDTRRFYHDPTSVLPTNEIVRPIGTNAVGRRIHKWDGNPQAFGIDVTGVADSTTALSNACAFAQVYAIDLVLPAGRIRVNSSNGPVLLIRTNGFKIRGAGRDLTQIIDDGNGVVLRIDDGDTYSPAEFFQRNTFEHFSIYGTNSSALIKAGTFSCYNTLRSMALRGANRAVDADLHAWGWVLDDVDIAYTGTGIYHGYSNPHWQYFGVKVRYAINGKLMTNRVSAFYVDDQEWVGGTISHCTNAVLAYGARWIRFRDTYFEENGSTVGQEPTIWLGPLSRGFQFSNPRFVNQRGHGFSVAGIGHSIDYASFTTIPSNRFGIHITTGASNTRLVTDADGPWAKGSGASITALSGGTGTNNALVQSNLTLASSGSGYSTNARLYIIGGNGRGATASIGISGSGTITNVTLTQGGTGYTGAPTISVHDWDSYLWDQGNKSQVNWLTIDRASAVGEAPSIIQQAGLVLNDADKTLWYVDRSGHAERVGGRPWYRYDGADQYGSIRLYSQDGTTRWGSIGASENQLNIQPGTTSANAWQFTTFGLQPVTDNALILGTSSRRILGSDIGTLTLHSRLVIKTNFSIATPPSGSVTLGVLTNGAGKHELVFRFPNGSNVVVATEP